MEVHVVKVPKIVGKAILLVAKIFDRSPKRPAKKVAPAEEAPLEETSEEALFADYGAEEEDEEKIAE